MKGKSYMRAQNRGNSVFAKMMTIVALMLTFIVTGAWAQQTYTVTFSANYSQTISDATLPYNKTISCTDLNRWAESFSSVNVEKGDGKVSASIDGGSMTITVSGAFSGEAEVWCPIIDDGGDQILYVVKVTCVANAPAEPVATYAVSLAEDTEDADNWTAKAGDATKFTALPLEGVAAGTAVTVKYNGTKKVKSVNAVKKANPAATVTTAPMAKTGVKAGEDVAIVNEGAAEGGTMMYMVNATQPASTDGFSATVPTAEGLTAGTYYVWYYVKADDSHTDSEISATGIEVTIASAAPALNLTSPAVGQVIGDDGKNYADAAAATSAGATAVAKICYVSGSNGLALALTDEGRMNWSTAITTAAAHTPAFTGGTWKLATKDEWTNMITAAGLSNLGLQVHYYWTSTEYDADCAWSFFSYSGNWSYLSKGSSDIYVRACLAF